MAPWNSFVTSNWERRADLPGIGGVQQMEQGITLGVKDVLDDFFAERLENLLKASSATIRVLSIGHQGDLCKPMVDVGGQCNNLVGLQSYVEGSKDDLFDPNEEEEEALEFPSSWKASLKTLDWKSGDENPICSDALLERLQGAREVSISISSTQLTSSWTVIEISTTEGRPTFAWSKSSRQHSTNESSQPQPSLPRPSPKITSNG